MHASIQQARRRDRKRGANGKTSTIQRKRALTAKLVSHQGWAVVR